VVTGEAVAVTLEKEEDFAAQKGKLKGKFVLMQPIREVKALFEAPGQRYSDQQLAELSQLRIGPRRGAFAGRGPGNPAQTEFRNKRMSFLLSEGVIAIIEPSPGDRGDSGAVRSRVLQWAKGHEIRRIHECGHHGLVRLPCRNSRAGAPAQAAAKAATTRTEADVERMTN
jgi:hypothetical protein